MAKRTTNSRGTHWLKTTLCVLAACAIAGTVISAIQFKQSTNRTSASAAIEFSFDGAADGIAPNGYAFDASAVSSDEVLEKALESAGMADRYTAEQIRAQLETQGVYPEDIVREMTGYDSMLDFTASRTLQTTKYHPTQYRVVLYRDFDKNISQADLEKLLACIMDAYKAYFAETYAAGTNEIGISYNLADYDYPQQLTILGRLMTESVNYAEEMYEKEPTLKAGGIGFNDIAVQLNSLISTDIEKLSANITINALTIDPERLITQYQYEIKSLNNELTNKKTQLERTDELLASYDKNEIIYLSTTDSLTKIDGNSSETYDKLVAARKQVADEITTINSKIATYQLRLANLTKTEEPAEAPAAGTAAAQTGDETGAETGEQNGDSENTETAAPAMTQEEIEALAAAAEEAARAQRKELEADIETLLAHRKTIMENFAGLIKAYNDKMINDLTVTVTKVTYDTPKFLSGAFIKQVVKTAGPICAVGFMVCVILIIVSRRKEEKAAERL